MKRIPALCAAALVLAIMCATALADGTPQLQFNQTTFDFGKTSGVTTVSGKFTFKNTGDGVLKIDPPKPSCGCTSAGVKPDTLAPGATGEIPFTLNLGFARGNLEKHITVRSNDPKTPEVSLAIKVNYSPLYEMTPAALSARLAFGVKETNLFTTITRTDGKPLEVTRIESSQPWIKAKVEPADPTNGTSARLQVTVQRNVPPCRFVESVNVFTADHSNSPASSFPLYGEILGEVSLAPAALYWSITDATKTVAPAQHVAIRSASGRPIEIKNLQTTLNGLKVSLVAKADHTAYDLVAQLAEVPTNSIRGTVTFETSAADQPRIEVPVVVNVYKR